uniref:tRNA (guanine-N(7)-)-methyltransferase n=1 Tax=Timspurckia oligopyrenoides TaxID=708627 RepID=A0A7S0ZE40_9RHOD|mmetsp:Transcript_174/g.294  ORF Transcript_174/g.294 Transcript_174/m.294 type:complete len:322 (+) Transcript_174:60-1025(+)|eukprot:CAMPEP_0182451784 /NCGR_PEP_ID=MMETSP1172-20130603/43908_1 /TAXON_ID=708627 /ORGANISM="Timspurckia oligopyrenoides, Strain CCMP3278" /LENGTH=321 /DNA_ID=CAMNT_0024649587 /DNA_START=762 /DNA_END=1727 /DNA_ORIENTATION=+
MESARVDCDATGGGMRDPPLQLEQDVEDVDSSTKELEESRLKKKEHKKRSKDGIRKSESEAEVPEWKKAKSSDFQEFDRDDDFLPVEVSGRIKWSVTDIEYRARAHSNPLNDGLFDVPISPESYEGDQNAEWADIGCGYGGLALELATHFPEKHIIGLEIRQRVHEYCNLQLHQLRKEYASENGYQNVSFVRSNAQKYLPHFFRKGQLSKLLICYPDPHFKKKKHRQRIVSPQLLAEYAYIMAPHGLLYIVTDVEELYQWMTNRIDAFSQFQRVGKEEIQIDPVAAYVRSFTNEAARVKKHHRPKFFACYSRLPHDTIKLS